MPRRLLLFTLLSLGALGGAAPALAADALVTVHAPDPARDVPRLERLGLDVTEDIRPGAVDVIVSSAAQRRAITAAGYRYRVRTPDLDRADARARAADRAFAAQVGRSALPSGRTTYRRYEDVLDELGALAGTNPGLVRRFELPRRSVEGRPIVGVEISQDVHRVDDGKPAYVVVGVHHAREWPSAEVSVEFALDLVQRFRSGDTRVAELLRHERIFVVPIVNPDGFIVSRENLTSPNVLPTQRSSQGARKRKNCAPTSDAERGRPCTERLGVDLNRNYGAYWGGPGASTTPDDDTYRGPGPFSEPESQAVHEFSRRLHVTNVQTIHNIAALILRPPGFRSQGLAPDEARLKALGDAMALATGYSSEYGYQLYEVTGATEDWNYDAQGAFGYTIELGGTGGFQGPYETNVVEQYAGRPGTATEGKGVREALLLAAEQAADPQDHAILRGTAPAGRILRLRKDFKTTTSPVCRFDSSTVDQVPSILGVSDAPVTSCAAPDDPILFDDMLDTTLAVGDDGRFTWHINPSTRPFVGKRGGTEAWTLTCETADGRVLQQLRFVIGRNETGDIDLACAGGPQQVAVRRSDPSPRNVVFGRALRAPAGLRFVVGRVRTTQAILRRRRTVRVGVRVRGGALRNLEATLRDGDRQVVGGAAVRRLRGRRVLSVRLPRGGLPRGTYRLTASAVASNGAVVRRAARVTVVRRLRR